LRAKLKISRLLLLTAVLASSASARAGNCPAKPQKYCDDGQRQILPVRIYRNFLVVAEGQFGLSSEGQNFILDTGTAPSIMNVSLASKLGSATLTSTFRALGKIVPSQAVMIPEIDLGPIQAVSLLAQVQDLSWLERDLGIPIAGVIGLDVLSKSSFHLDYDKREIEFGEFSRVGIPVQFDAHTGFAVAKAKIEGKEARFLVDTGSDRVVLFGGNFSDAGWLALRNTSQTGASQADQKIRVQAFSAAIIILGGRQFSVDRAYLVPGSADPAFDGLLGVRALGFRSLSYDQATGTLFLQK
jgi:hypothetical protein